MNPVPDIAVIACAVLEDEVRHFARELAHVRELIFLPQGLHNEPLRLRRELQAAVNRAESRPEVQVIVLVYGLCSRGVEDLRHARCPLVIARAHDCVTLFLGSKERYAEQQRAHPGTYWYTPGWIKAHAPPGPERMVHLRREYEARFGPEEVEYLLEMERQGLAGYDRAAYVDLDVGDTRSAAGYTRHCAASLGWSFERVRGDASLLRDLLAGKWDEARFLIVPPREVIRLTVDPDIIRSLSSASEA